MNFGAELLAVTDGRNWHCTSSSEQSSMPSVQRKTSEGTPGVIHGQGRGHAQGHAPDQGQCQGRRALDPAGEGG